MIVGAFIGVFKRRFGFRVDVGVWRREGERGVAAGLRDDVASGVEVRRFRSGGRGGERAPAGVTEEVQDARRTPGLIGDFSAQLVDSVPIFRLLRENAEVPERRAFQFEEETARAVNRPRLARQRFGALALRRVGDRFGVEVLTTEFGERLPNAAETERVRGGFGRILPTLPVPLILSGGRRRVGFLRDETGVGAAPKGGRAASDSFGDGAKTVEKEGAEAFETATGAEVDENVFLFGKHKNGKVGEVGESCASG